MPDRSPQYRYRGNVRPCAEVARPVAVRRNAATESRDGEISTSATIDIFDVIDSWGWIFGISARDVDAALKQAGDVGTLYVRINSPGGEATEGVAIANLLRAHPASVHVSVIGLAASAASYIAAAGDTVTMAPGSLLMIHEASSLALGTAEDMRKEANALDAVGDSIASLYALKAGGDTDEWRDRMRTEVWYTADAAVEAGLADRVGSDPAPSPESASDAAGETEQMGALDAAAARFDLSMYANLPEAIQARIAAHHGLPAEPPETQETTDHEEAVTMTEAELKALRERLGLPEDADASAIHAKLDADDEAHEKVIEDLESKVVAAQAAATAPEGKVLVSQNVLDELRDMAKDGAEARAQQRAEARDAAIDAAFKAGKISAERKPHWAEAWDKDPDGTRADLDSLPARFPVAKLTGYTGGTNEAEDKAFTDAEADEFAALLGTTKEALA